MAGSEEHKKHTSSQTIQVEKTTSSAVFSAKDGGHEKNHGTLSDADAPIIPPQSADGMTDSK